MGELVRHRQQPVKASTAARAGIRALLAKHGIRLVATELDSITGTELLDQLKLRGAHAKRLATQRRLMVHRGGNRGRGCP